MVLKPARKLMQALAGYGVRIDLSIRKTHSERQALSVIRLFFGAKLELRRV